MYRGKNRICVAKKIAALILSGMCILTTTACDSSSITGIFQKQTTEETKEYSFDVVGETSTLGIREDDKDFLSKLVNNSYYVVHDGVYYPLVSYIKNEAAEEPLNEDYQVDDWRMLFFTTESENDIPTFYKGDKLVYYSTDTLLNYITWERYYDLGYTLGLNNIHTNIAGRCYIDLKEDKNSVLPDGPLAEASNTKSNLLLVDKIGGVQLTEDYLDYGIVAGIEKDKEYDVEIYNGTQFGHYDATGNYHAFRAYEMFDSIEYDTMQDFLYEIKIPEYFVDGYYVANEFGIFRYINGDAYNSDTDFNKQLLYQYNGDPESVKPAETENPENPENTENNISEEEEEYVLPFLYSDFPELNRFTSHKEGTLGYTPLEEDENVVVAPTTEEEEEEPKQKETIKQSIVKNFDLWLPKDVVCTVKIKSKTKEKTGNIVATFSNGNTKKGSYDFVNDEYVLELNGKGEKITLSINGFFTGYTIELINAEQYNGQDNAGTETTKEQPAEKIGGE